MASSVQRAWSWRGFRRGLGELRRARRGQAAAEFLLMMAVSFLVVLMVIEIAFLGGDLLITRYASFLGARGYLARDPLWRDGCDQVGGLVVQNTGRMDGTALGDGVRFTVEIQEFFPLRTLFGDSQVTDLVRETYLGPPEPPLRGDNQAQSAPGG